jgi:predicted MFS family arabinose efflux permease
MSQSSISERKLLFLLAAIQFVNVTDFMMVLPLGPDFAAGLNIASNRLGLVAGIYTATAALAGLVGTLFLDKFDRRNALFVAMVGLVAGTVAGGFATGLGTMLMARVVAGAFGGPATALTLSILTDQIAPARRGRAFGIVMGSFSVASVVGVPLGLKLAELGGWRTTFFSVAGMGAVLVPAVIWMMPPMRGHLDGAARRVPARPLRAFFADPSVLLSLLAVAATMLGAFALIANLAAFLQFNLGYPRQHIDKLYAAGGAVAFVTMRIAGRIVDRRGSVLVTIIGTAVTVAVIAATFLPMHPWIPAVGLFIGFMMGKLDAHGGGEHPDNARPCIQRARPFHVGTIGGAAPGDRGRHRSRRRDSTYQPRSEPERHGHGCRRRNRALAGGSLHRGGHRGAPARPRRRHRDGSQRRERRDLATPGRAGCCRGSAPLEHLTRAGSFTHPRRRLRRARRASGRDAGAPRRPTARARAPWPTPVPRPADQGSW